MNPPNLASSAKITWCPGCPNSAILVAFRKAISELVAEGALKPENLVVGAGVGCHGKISDYLETNTFDSLHGRVIPSMTGIKAANPNLTVVAFTGDGDSFSEGFSHITHAAQRNSDITVFIHNNQTFALTTGQATATSPEGFKGGSTPEGSIDTPIVPLEILLAMNASFAARTYASDINGTTSIMKKAILHKGFSAVEIIQPCITFYDTRKHFNESVYWMPEHEFPTGDIHRAMWKTCDTEGGKTPLGIFYSANRPTFEERL